MSLAGQIVRVPSSVCESGFIKIVADATKCLPLINRGIYGSDWDYLFVPYDPVKGRLTNSYFRATKKEMKEWLKNGNKNNT